MPDEQPDFSENVTEEIKLRFKKKYYFLAAEIRHL